jgi:hypothetical protein
MTKVRMLLVVLYGCGIDTGLLVRDLMKTEDMRTNKARVESYVYLQPSRLPPVIPLILKTHPSTILTPARITNEMPTSFIDAGASAHSIVGVGVVLCVEVQC